MFDFFSDLFERDRRRSGDARPRGLRGLLSRLFQGEHDEGHRSHRRHYADDDDDYEDRYADSRQGRRRRDRDWDDD